MNNYEKPSAAVAAVPTSPYNEAYARLLTQLEAAENTAEHLITVLSCRLDPLLSTPCPTDGPGRPEEPNTLPQSKVHGDLLEAGDRVLSIRTRLDNLTASIADRLTI